MRKAKFFAFLFALIVLASSSAFALQCKAGNFGSDECWTNVKFTTNDGAVIAGTVLVYDFTTGINEGNSADEAAWTVRIATTTDQGSIVAGVAQQSYSSGDTGLVLVRGKGKLRMWSTSTTSGDRLYVVGEPVSTRDAGLATTNEDLPISANNAASKDKPIAFSLNTYTSAQTIDAYITIV